MIQWLDNAGTLIQTSPWLAVVVVFVGGLLTASNPCSLAMIPLMVSFVAGSRDTSPLRAFGLSLTFVLGLAVTFVAMGMVAALAGRIYGDVSSVWNWIVAAVCVVMGLHLMGVLPIPIPQLVKVQPKIRGPVGAFVLGLLFGFVSAPCAAPILVVVLTYLAGTHASVTYGGLLLLAFALGHSTLVLVAGTSMGLARRILESKRMTRATDLLRRAAGLAIIVIGVYFAIQGVTG
jgi:cytochrome c-type biogenesis protein